MPGWSESVATAAVRLTSTVLGTLEMLTRSGGSLAAGLRANGFEDGRVVSRGLEVAMRAAGNTIAVSSMSLLLIAPAMFGRANIGASGQSGNTNFFGSASCRDNHCQNRRCTSAREKPFAGEGTQLTTTSQELHPRPLAGNLQLAPGIAYFTSSAVATAPFICGRMLVILTTRRSALFTQTVVVSPIPSAGVITTFQASKAPAGTVTFSLPSTLSTRGFTCCDMMSKLRNVVV